MFRPVIIIGAARSGTNMLRDVLTRLHGVGTWPCDEINAVWRYRNTRVPHDELTPDDATPVVRAHIRRAFRRLARNRHLAFVVEKTCANSLRVDFVDCVVPEAKFLFLVRDGRDVVPSAMTRWTAPLDFAYVARKARYVPITALPGLAAGQLTNRWRRWRSRDARLRFWGPRCSGLDELAVTRPLVEVCAVQWVRCVESSRSSFARMSTDRVLSLRYESFVSKPLEHLSRIVQFLGLPVSVAGLRGAVRDVSSRRVGSGHRKLDEVDQRRIAKLLELALSTLGYLQQQRAA